jgi:hypothetical protein
MYYSLSRSKGIVNICVCIMMIRFSWERTINFEIVNKLK